MDLRLLLHLVQNPGQSLEGVKDSLTDPPGNLEKRTHTLIKDGVVRPVKVGGEEKYFPATDSPTVVALEELSSVEEYELEGVLNPTNNLRMVHVLAGGPQTLEGLIKVMESSERTVYRVLSVYEENCPGLVRSVGSKEKIFSLDPDHPLRDPISRLAASLFDGVEQGAAELNKTRRFTSLRTRILLHLSVPSGASAYPLTQQGLARALWTSQPIISKELTRLMQKGIVTSRRTAIHDMNRPLNTYYISDEGLEELEQVNGILANLTVNVRDPNGGERAVPIGQVPGLVKTKVSLVDVLNLLEQEDVVDIDKLQGIVENLLESDMVLEAHRLPELRHFFGREEELSQVREWLGSDGAPVLCVKGIAGIGKTTFMSRIVEEHQSNWNILYYPVNEWSTLRNLLLPIANMLEKMDSFTLRSYLQSKGEVNIEEAIMILEEALSDVHGLIIFDDVQKAEERVRFFLRALIESGVVGRNKLLLAGREIANIFDLRTQLIQGKVQQISLTGLDKEAGFRLLEKRGIDSSEFERIFADSEGHPLALEISEVSADASVSNIERFFEIEIASKLNSVERGVLRYATVFRGPVPLDAMLHLREAGMDGEEDVQIMEVVQRLMERLLLNRSGNSYRMHDILREHLATSMDGPLKRSYHKIAADHYSVMGNDWANVESIFHFVEAGDLTAAGAVLERSGESLVLRGFSEDLRDIFSGVDLEEAPPEAKLHIHYIRGEIELLRGELDAAMEDFVASSKYCDELGLEQLNVRCKLKLGNIYEAQGMVDEAVSAYREELVLATKYDKVLYETDAYRCLALLYSRRGEYEEVMKCMESAKEKADSNPDPLLMANYYDIQSLYFWMVHDAEELDKHVDEYMELFKSIANIDRQLKFVNNMAYSLYQNKRYERAVEINDWQIELAQSKGHLRVGLFGLHTSILCLIELGEFEEVERRVGTLIEQADRFQEKRLMFGAEYIQARILQNKGDDAGACERYETAIAHFEEYKWYFRLPWIYYHYANLREGMGEKAEATRLFEKSLEYAEIMKDEEVVEKAKKRLG